MGDVSLPKIIKLSRPVTIGDAPPITEIVIEREPEAGDLYDFPATNQKMGDLLNIAGKLTGNPPSFMKKLSITDAMKCAEVVGDFLPDGPEIGASR